MPLVISLLTSASLVRHNKCWNQRTSSARANTRMAIKMSTATCGTTTTIPAMSCALITVASCLTSLAAVTEPNLTPWHSANKSSRTCCSSSEQDRLPCLISLRGQPSAVSTMCWCSNPISPCRPTSKTRSVSGGRKTSLRACRWAPRTCSLTNHSYQCSLTSTSYLSWLCSTESLELPIPSRALSSCSSDSRCTKL